MSEIKTNLSPIKTSQNYGVNEFMLDENLFKRKQNSKVNFEIKNLSEKVIKNEKILPQCALNEICLEQHKTADINKCFELNSSEENTKFININLDQDLVENLRFITEKDVKTKLIINILGSIKSYHNLFLDFILKKNSVIDVIVISELEEQSVSLINIEAEQGENSKFNLTFIDFSPTYSINRIYSKLAGTNAKADVKTLYFGKQNAKIDLNIFLDVFGENSNAKIETVGALLDYAEKNFKGTIRFNKGSKKSVGDEKEYCMLLSKNAKSKALPTILCAEDDVEGKHSSSVGSINKNQLFYLLTRGLSKTDAEKLMVKTKTNSILSSLFDDEIRQRIENKLENKLSKF